MKRNPVSERGPSSDGHIPLVDTIATALANTHAQLKALHTDLSTLDRDGVSRLVGKTKANITTGVVQQLAKLDRRAEEMKTELAQRLVRMRQEAQEVAQLIEDTTTMRGGFSFRFFSFEYMARLVFSVLLLAFATYVNAVASAVAGYRTPLVVMLDVHGNDTGSKTLPDLGHELIPYVNWFELPDLVLSTFVVFTTGAVILHPKRLMILRRVCFIMGIVYLLRSLTVVLTSLPDASPECQAQFKNLDSTGKYKLEPMWPAVLYRGWLLMAEPAQHITCGDMIFSGHTSAFVMCSMVFKQYCRPRDLKLHGRVWVWVLFIVRKMAYSVTAFGALAIIGTRLHYTLDVAMAMVICYVTWTSYHNWARTPWIKSRIPLMAWLEAEQAVIRLDEAAFRKFTGGRWDHIGTRQKTA